MANKCGLFIAPVLESDGTNALTGKRSGTAVSIGGASPIVVGALDTVYTAYVRTVDDSTGEDTQQDSTTNVIVTPPANIQVCKTYNGTFTGSALDLTVKCIGGNQPFYFKQTASASGSASLNIGALDWTAGTRVGQVGTVTPTAGDAQVSLAWAAVAGAAGYEYQYSTSATFASGNSAWIDNTDRAPVITGLANGTVYYFRVRAYAATGVGASSTTVSIVVGSWTMDFSAGAALDTAKITAYTSGSGTSIVASNKWTLDASAAVSAAAMGVWQEQVTKAVHTYQIKFTPITMPSSYDTMVVLQLFGVKPTACWPTTSEPAARTYLCFRKDGTSKLQMYVAYKTAANGDLLYDQNSAQWLDATVGASWNNLPLYTLGTSYVATLETTATQWRFTVYDATKTTTIYQCPWTDFSAIHDDATSNYYLVTGEPFTDIRRAKLEVLSVSKS